MQDRVKHHLRINIDRPVTYARQGQTPFTYDHQQPFTYQDILLIKPAACTIRSAQQSPFTYGHPAAAQSPFTYTLYERPFYVCKDTGQTPFTYQATGHNTSYIQLSTSHFRILQTWTTHLQLRMHNNLIHLLSVQASSTPSLASGRQPYIYAAYTYHNHWVNRNY